MRGILGLGMEGRFHDGLDLIALGSLGTGFARRLVLQTGHPALQEMIAPQNDSWPTGFELLSDAPIG